MNKKSPPLIRLFGSLIYELFALVPIWMVAGFIFIYFFDGFFGVHQRLIFQIYLWLISGVYLTYCWKRSGQTLAMRAWKLKITSTKGLLGTLLGGVSFIWALTNKKHFYLHDQILKNYFTDVRFYKSSLRQSKRK
jgi:uncharacterized RDD family membrane protein YckC